MTDAPNPESTGGAPDPATAQPAPPAQAGPPMYPVPPAYLYAPAGGSGQPPPVSAVPVSAYPTTGYPGYPVPPPRLPTRKGPWLWVLVAVGTVLAASIGALGYFVTTANAASQRTAAAHDAKLENLEKDIRHKERVIEVAEDDRDYYNELLDEEQAVLTDLQEECPAAVQAYVDTAIAGDEAAFEQAVSRMITVCHL